MDNQDKAKGLNTDMITAIYRLAVVVLLAGILVAQWQILGRTGTAAPISVTQAGPTNGDLRSARGREAKREVSDRVPLVRILGGVVRINNPISIDSASVAQIRGEQ